MLGIKNRVENYPGCHESKCSVLFFQSFPHFVSARSANGCCLLTGSRLLFWGKKTKNKSITLFSSSTSGVEFRRKDFCSAPFPDSSNKFTLKSLSLCLSFPVTSWWPSVLFKLLVKILLSLWLIKISKIKSDLHLALAHISNIYLLCTLPKQTKKVSRSFQRGKQSEEMKHEEKETNRRLCSQKNY